MLWFLIKGLFLNESWDYLIEYFDNSKFLAGLQVIVCVLFLIFCFSFKLCWNITGTTVAHNPGIEILNL